MLLALRSLWEEPPVAPVPIPTPVIAVNQFACIAPCVACDTGPGGGIGPVDPANPFANLSSEDPDSNPFIGRGRTGGRPPLGSNWLSSYCFGFCISTVSQEDADLCAANASVACLSNEWPTGSGSEGDPTTPRPIYYSSAQYCALTCPDGTEFRFTTAPGLFTTLDNQATADTSAYTYACTQVIQNFICLGALSVTRACLDEPYYATVKSISPNPPITWTVTGTLPPGLALTFDATNAIISGTPTVGGDYPFTLTGTDSLGNQMQKDYSISIFGISSTSPLPEGDESSYYSEFLGYGGTPVGAVTWSVTAGLLPTGTTLDPATGEISGTPTVPGVFLFTIKASDES